MKHVTASIQQGMGNCSYCGMDIREDINCLKHQHLWIIGRGVPYAQTSKEVKNEMKAFLAPYDQKKAKKRRTTKELAGMSSMGSKGNTGGSSFSIGPPIQGLGNVDSHSYNYFVPHGTLGAQPSLEGIA